MAVSAEQRDATAVEERPVWREDLVAAICGTALVLGLFLDGWNHINLQDGALGGFFTRWHALLYTGFSLAAGWVVHQNRHLWKPNAPVSPHLHRVLGRPLRYPYAMVGIALASVGMGGDLVWHEVFGDERGVARVIAPFHLVLFAGAAMVISAPVRSAWYSPTFYPRRPSFRQLLPAVLALTLITASIAFMFQWLSAFVEWTPSLNLGDLPAGLARDEQVVGTAEFAGVARVLVTNIVLVTPLFIALRRWLLPPPTATFLFTGVALLMSALTELRSGWLVVAAIVGGVTADVLIQRLRPGDDNPTGMRVLAAGTAGATWVTYFVVLRVAYDIRWPFDLWAGAVGLCVVTAVVLSMLAVPPLAARALVHANVDGAPPVVAPPPPPRRSLDMERGGP